LMKCGVSTVRAATCCSVMVPSVSIRPLPTPTSGWPCARATRGRRTMASDVDLRRKLAVESGGVLAMIGIALVIWSCLPSPKLQAEENVFNTVDALFTALTCRDRARLDACERRLKDYHDDGRMSDAVARTRESIIQLARDGKWEPAAKELYVF